ncbi:hypothetical protein [Planococcus salinus]|uniref:Uncharacterized protein n=1 Tax=Planococcus salinus TaxID=1848460 RepID=A0A3M8P3K8_9BACL|nr:hypothetical protein [Planococcus salinus]RNF38289.1 hypothetical protein EEX84_15290 [Planococcus salinus]
MTFYKKLGPVFWMLAIALVLSACSDPIYSELGVSADESPLFEEKDRREGAKKTFIMVDLASEGSGEDDAKKSMADSFSKLKEEYRVATIMLIDKEQEDWYGVYMEDDTVINYIKASTEENLMEEEKALLDFYRSVEDSDFPVIHFSSEPILDLKYDH